MSQIEAAKLVETVVIGHPPDSAIVSKLVMIVVLEPGSDGASPDVGQGFVSSHVVRKPSR